MAEYYDPDGLPTAVVYEDEHGPLIRTSPFGHHGPVLGMTFDRWRQLSTAVNTAVDAHFATRYSAAPQ
ncbi:hypothetical protein A5695_13305 [Mycobacterium sp. E1747]|nr:hypothetical protein A5695_13305 [Mycobacterium sp. E1747]